MRACLKSLSAICLLFSAFMLVSVGSIQVEVMEDGGDLLEWVISLCLPALLSFNLDGTRWLTSFPSMAMSITTWNRMTKNMREMLKRSHTSTILKYDVFGSDVDVCNIIRNIIRGATSTLVWRVTFAERACWESLRLAFNHNRSIMCLSWRW